MLEWIQDYMVSHYGLKEIWLGGDYPDPSKKATGEIPATSNGTDAESKAQVAPIHWDKPPRSGLFTVNEEDVPRVTEHAMQRHAKVNIFISENFYTADRVLVIVQGSGAVRPGQWARALCINNNLKAGTIFDYLDIARECNLGVIVLNPNQDRIRLRVISEAHPNGTFHPTHVYPILGHEEHGKHIVHIYDHFIAKTAAKDLFMVAHSRGGSSAVYLLNNRLEKSLLEKSVHQLVVEEPTEEEIEEGRRARKNQPKVGTITAEEAEQIEQQRRRAESDDEEETVVDEIADDGSLTDLQKRLRALAFTDSVHWSGEAASDVITNWLGANAKDWVASKEPLDTPMPDNRENAGCECVSAGHSKHEWTSPCAVNSVFDFFFSTIDNPPHFAPRQVPFSNPPQHMPKEVDHDAKNPSYAAIAARPAATTSDNASSTSPSSSSAKPSVDKPAAEKPAAVAESKQEKPVAEVTSAHPSYAAVATGLVHPEGAPPTDASEVTASTYTKTVNTETKFAVATHTAPETAEHPSYAAVAAGLVHPEGSPPSGPAEVTPTAASTSTSAATANSNNSVSPAASNKVAEPAKPTATTSNNTAAAAPSTTTSTDNAAAPSSTTAAKKPAPAPEPERKTPGEPAAFDWTRIAIFAGVAVAAIATASYFVFRPRVVKSSLKEFRR